MIEIKRNVMVGQWKGCIFIQVGATCLSWQVFKSDKCWGVEILTPMRWFALAPFRRLTWRRG